VTLDFLEIWFYIGILCIVAYAGREVWHSIQSGEWERESLDRMNIFELMERDKEEKK
jgi:hypothetical protein